MPDLHEMSPLVVGTLTSGRWTQKVPDLHEMSPVVVGTLKIGRRDTKSARFT